MERSNKIKLFKRVISKYITQNDFYNAESYLLSYDFIRKKILFVGVEGLIDDYKLLLNCDISDEQRKKALGTMLSVFEQIAHILKGFPKQINSQLLGFLEKKINPYIDNIINAIYQRSKDIWLCPMQNNLSSAQGNLTCVFEGQKNVYAFEFSSQKDIFYTSSTQDNASSILMWNTNSKELMKSFEDDNDEGESILEIKEVNNTYICAFTINSHGDSIKVWDIESEELLERIDFKDEPGKFYLNNFWEDIKVINNLLITIHPEDKSKLVFWDIPSIDPKFTILLESKIIAFSCIEFYRNKNKIIRVFIALNFSLTSSSILIYEIENNRLELINKMPFVGVISDLLFSTEYNKLIVASEFGATRILDISNGKDELLSYSRRELGTRLRKISYNQNEKYLFSYYSKYVEILKMPSGKKIMSYNLISPDKQCVDTNRIDVINDKLLVLDGDNLKIWDLLDVKLLYKSTGWRESFFLKFIDEYRVLCGKHNFLSCWTVKNSRSKSNILHQKPIRKIKVLNNNEILTSSEDGTIKMIDIKTSKIKHTFFNEPVYNFKFFKKNNESFALSLSKAGQVKELMNYEIKIWNLTQKKFITKLGEHRALIHNIKIIKNNRFVISSCNNEIKKWDLFDKECTLKYKIEPGKLFRGAEVFKVYNNDDNFVSGDENGCLRIWNLDYEYPFLELKVHDELISSIEIDETSKLMLTGSRDNDIKLWQLEVNSLTFIKTFKGHKRTVENVMFLYYDIYFDENRGGFTKKNSNLLNFNPSYFISASNDGLIKIWCIENGNCLKTLKGHKDNSEYRRSLNFILFKNKPMVLSYSIDGRIIIWDILSGNKITSLFIERTITTLIITEDEEKIVVGEENGQVHFIKIENNEGLRLKES